MESSIGVSVVQLLWKISWQAALFGAMVWLVCRLARKAPARVRYALWLAVLVKLLVPPFAHFPYGWAFWRQPEPSAPTYVAAAPVVKPPIRTEAKIADSGRPALIEWRTVPPAPVAETPDCLWPDLLALIWLAGVGTTAAVLAVRIRKQSQLIASSSPAPESVSLMLDDCAKRLSVGRLPAIRTSNEAPSPMVVGLLHPTILLPTAVLDACDERELRAMLAHELAHVKRFDMAGVWLDQAVRMIFFFHPVVWLAGRGMRKERELACDEMVLSRTAIGRRAYASGYLSALKLASGFTTAPVAIGMAEPFEVEKDRLTRILEHPIRPVTALWVLVIAAVFLAGFFTFSKIGKKPWKKPNYPRTIRTGDNGWMILRAPTWKQGKITARVMGIHREVAEGKDWLSLEIRVWNAPKEGSISHFKLLDESGRPLQTRRDGMKYDSNTGPFDHNPTFDVPRKGTKTLQQLTAILDDSKFDHPTYGPYSLRDLSEPIKIGGPVPVVQVVDWAIEERHNQMISFTDADKQLSKPVVGQTRIRYRRPEIKNASTAGCALTLYILAVRDKRHNNRADIPAWYKPYKNRDEFPVLSIDGIAGSGKAVNIERSSLDENATDDWLGLQAAGDPPSDVPTQVNPPQVTWVTPGGPAERAGIRPGDVITEVGGRRVRSALWLSCYYRRYIVSDTATGGKGKLLSMTIDRNGRKLKMIIRPESDPRWQQLLAAKQSNSAKLIKVAGIGSYGQVQAYRLTIRDYLVESHVGSRYEYRSFHMDRSFRVKSITLKRTVPVKPTKVYNIKFQNIPLPPDLWQSGGAAPSAVGIRH